MTNKKSVKRTLLLSIMAMLLCVTMLIGTTFAWFTDSVTSSGNIISSGTLDVTMEWADGKTDPASTQWIDASTGAIFNHANWEPGYVEVRHLKISNVGTLALKYQIYITANGEVSDLSDVIDVYYVDPAMQVADRNVLDDSYKLGTLTEVLDNLDTSAKGNLLADKSETITIALKMQESAGNEYQNKSIGSDFSIVLMATQYTFEKDSFGIDYDDIDIPEMDIKTINGVNYGRTTSGEYVMISVNDYTLTDFTVDDEVTVLGTGNGIHDNDRIFGKNAPLTSLTLPEGLKEIKDNALNTLPNLTTVNFPSTLKTIGIQAFRITGMSELTIPENVEVIKEGAFRDMANLTTVTIEGNPILDNYVFRSCPNLNTIFLLGDDVQFVGGGQFATHQDTGYSNPLVIYVQNSTVAARVKAAQSSATDYEIKIMGDAADGSDAKDVIFVNNLNEFKTALENIQNDETIVFAKDITGNVTVTQKAGVSFTIEGASKKYTGMMTIFGDGRQSGAESLTIKNVDFVAANGAASAIYSPDRKENNKYSYSHNVTVSNCTFTDPDGTVDCAAVRHGDGGDKNWKILNCKVDNTMHSLVQVNNVVGYFDIIGCEVNSKNGANFNSCVTVDMTDCTFNVKGYALRFGPSNGGAPADIKTYNVTNCTLESACDDGDAIIMYRSSAKSNSTLTLTGTKLIGATEFNDDIGDAVVIRVD